MSEALGSIPLSTADLVVVGLLCLYTFFGFLHGFLDGTIRLAALAAMVLMFTHGAKFAIERFGIDLGLEPGTERTVVAVVAIAPILVASILLRIAAKLVPPSGIGNVAGLAVGFLRGNIAVVVLVYAANLFFHEYLKDREGDSKVVPLYVGLTKSIVGDLDAERRVMLGRIDGAETYDAIKEGAEAIQQGQGVLDEEAYIERNLELGNLVEQANEN